MSVYEKDVNSKNMAFSPIAGVELGHSANNHLSSSDPLKAKSEVKMPDLSSVHRTSDAFSLRLSLTANEDSVEDMSIDDSLVLQQQPSDDIQDSFQFHDNGEAPSAHGFFAERDPKDDSDNENISPIRPSAPASQKDYPGQLFPSNPPSSSTDRWRDSVAPFFRGDSGITKNGSLDEREADEARVDSTVTAKPAQDLRRRDSVAPFFLGSDSPVDFVPPAERNQKFRTRDSVAHLFNEVDELDSSLDAVDALNRDELTVAQADVRAKGGRKSRSIRNIRDSVAPFFGQESPDSPASVVTGKANEYRRRDSVAPFFQQNSDDSQSDGNGILNVSVGQNSIVGMKPIPQLVDDAANVFVSNNVDVSDVSMDLGEDASFLDSAFHYIWDFSKDNRQLKNCDYPLLARGTKRKVRSSILDSCSLPNRKEVDDSFEEFSPLRTPNASKQPSDSALSTPTSAKARPTRSKRASPSPAPSTRVLRSAKSTPTVVHTPRASEQESSVKAAGRSTEPTSQKCGSRRSTPSRRVMPYAPVVSSPLRRVATPVFENPDDSLEFSPIGSQQEPEIGTDAIATNNATNSQESGGDLIASLLQSAETTALATLVRTPRSTSCKTAPVQTPLLLKFVKSMEKKTTTPKNIPRDIGLLDGEDFDDDADVDDTFHKPCNLFAKVASARASLTSKAISRQSVGKEETVVLPTIGCKDLMDEKMEMVDFTSAFSVPASISPASQDPHNKATEHNPQEEAADEDKITLDDFLQATGLQFIDGLSTTLRRETNAFKIGEGESPSLSVDYARAACVYMPELTYFESACKVLTDYVEEGRLSMKDLEEDISRNTPTVFYTYADASDSVQDEMLGKLKALKSLARLKTKESWYGWRKNLLIPFHEAIVQNTEVLKKDLCKMTELKKGLVESIDSAATVLSELQKKRDVLSKRFDEFSQCDPTAFLREESENKRLRSVLSDAPAIIDESRNSLRVAVAETVVLEKKKAMFVDTVNELTKEYEKLCDMMPDDVVGIQESYKLAQTALSWCVQKSKDSAAGAPVAALDFEGLAKIHLSSPLKMECSESPGLATPYKADAEVFMAAMTMEAISHNATRIKILVGDIDEAKRECTITTKIVHHVGQSPTLEASAYYFNREKRMRFVVVFSFELAGEIVYPFGQLQHRVFVYYGCIRWRVDMAECAACVVLCGCLWNEGVRRAALVPGTRRRSRENKIQKLNEPQLVSVLVSVGCLPLLITFRSTLPPPPRRRYDSDISTWSPQARMLLSHQQQD
ncbi:hypothetical protein HDU82_004552 [Entophlyctis luteolus]|nr:hypothetical protein HDU82_004552 [Entophlyctis luteolus]